MILYINCCVREESRTNRLAQAVLKNMVGEIVELKLYEKDLRPLDNETLIKRMTFVGQADFSDKMFDYAKQFAAADDIVIAAPYWDLSFPAMLKTYIENIYVIGVVTDYDEKGIPLGMCKAKRLIYVTTAGGPYDPSYSYGYVESLAKKYFGIKETSLIKAEMLDIAGCDAEQIMEGAIKQINQHGFHF